MICLRHHNHDHTPSSSTPTTNYDHHDNQHDLYNNQHDHYNVNKYKPLDQSTDSDRLLPEAGLIYGCSSAQSQFLDYYPKDQDC